MIFRFYFLIFLFFSVVTNASELENVKLQKYAINLTDEEIAYLKKKKVIKMCIDPHWMPFESFDDKGRYIGMSADYFKIFQKCLDVDIEVVKSTDWDESVKFAKSRKCDILSLVMKTPRRSEYLNFTSSYLNIPLVIATKLDVSFVDNIASIEDKKVAITKGYAYVEILKSRYPNLEIIEVKNIDEGLDEVREGEVFGYIGTIASIGYKFQTKYNGELKIAGKFDEDWNLGVGVRNDDATLLRIFQKAVDSVDAKQRQKILNNWVSIVYEKGFDYEIFYKVVGFLFFIFIFMLYRQYELKRINQKLTKNIKNELEKSHEKDKLIFHQNKMASLGEMIGNIAHQWRQPLARVSMIQNYLLTQLDEDDKNHQDMIEEIKNSQNVLQFMSKTIDTFYNFYKVDKEIITVFDINQVVDEVLEILSESIHIQNIEVIKRCEKNLLVKGEFNALSHAILSIVQNSTYFLNLRAVEYPKISIDIAKADGIVTIILSDNAGGIDEEKLTHIFEYGYSSRDDASASTGIGLYISNLVLKEKFFTQIEVENIQDGVSFKIFLPLYNTNPHFSKLC